MTEKVSAAIGKINEILRDLEAETGQIVFHRDLHT